MSVSDADRTFGSSVQYVEPSSMKSGYPAAIVFAAAVIFHSINSSISRVAAPPADKSSKTKYNWRNIATSFVHATIVGSWSLLCLYKNPEILDDLINRHTRFGEVLVAVSVGYFTYDLYDMLNYKKIKDVWPLMLHHITIIVCFGIALTTKKYIYYAVVSLLCEVNSIFLHGRQLLQMMSTSRNSALYTVNSFVNIVTFVIFRFGVLLWMAWWLLVNHALLPLVLVGVAMLGLVIMTSVNVVLFLRLLKSDFIRKRGDTVKDVLDK